MDSNAGEFVGEDRAEAWMQRISLGEVVKIKGEELEVVAIERRTIVLKLLSIEDRIRAIDKRLAEANFTDLAEAESKRQLENVLRRQR